MNTDTPYFVYEKILDAAKQSTGFEEFKSRLHESNIAFIQERNVKMQSMYLFFHEGKEYDLQKVRETVRSDERSVYFEKHLEKFLEGEHLREEQYQEQADKYNQRLQKMNQIQQEQQGWKEYNRGRPQGHDHSR